MPHGTCCPAWSQPEIICGNKPWDPRTRPEAGFPFRAGTKHLSVDFDAGLRARGIYNMTFSLWGVSAIPASRKDITHEIMIWVDSARQSPAGQRVDSMSVNGTVFDVYIEEHQRDASGANSNTWTYVAFVAQRPVLRGPLEISAFVDYLLRRGTLTNSHYLTSLEFGTEVSQGSGLTEIQDFALQLQVARHGPKRLPVIPEHQPEFPVSPSIRLCGGIQSYCRSSTLGDRPCYECACG